MGTRTESKTPEVQLLDETWIDVWTSEDDLFHLLLYQTVDGRIQVAGIYANDPQRALVLDSIGKVVPGSPFRAQIEV
jgi:hypothetical protein